MSCSLYSKVYNRLGYIFSIFRSWFLLCSSRMFPSLFIYVFFLFISFIMTMPWAKWNYLTVEKRNHLHVPQIEISYHRIVISMVETFGTICVIKKKWIFFWVKTNSVFVCSLNFKYTEQFTCIPNIFLLSFIATDTERLYV